MVAVVSLLARSYIGWSLRLKHSSVLLSIVKSSLLRMFFLVLDYHGTIASDVREQVL